MVGISIYPDSIDTDVQLEHLVDKSSLVLSKHINSLRDSIFSIERAMGVRPFGPFDTVGERVSKMDSTFLPLVGGDMEGNLNIQYSIAEIPSSFSIDQEVAVAFDELSFYTSDDMMEVGNVWAPTALEIEYNASADGVVPMSIVGKNVLPLPTASGSMAGSNRRKVRLYDDAHVAGSNFVEDFISAPRILLEKNVVPSNFSTPTGGNASVVKSLIGGALSVNGDISAKHAMSYLGGVLIERWWSDPDFLFDDRVCEVGLVIPTDFFNQANWKSLMIMYGAEFQEENIVAQLYINHKVASGPILYSKLSKNRSMCNFAVFNKADLDGDFGWTNTDASQSYLENLDGTFSTTPSSIGMDGDDQYNDSSKNENKFWNNNLSVKNCYGKDIINYVSPTELGDKVIRISLKLAKHAFHFPTNPLAHSKFDIYQNSAAYVEGVETNLINASVLRAASPDVRNVQITVIAINDDGFNAEAFDIGSSGLINRRDLGSVWSAGGNKAINPDRVGAH